MRKRTAKQTLANIRQFIEQMSVAHALEDFQARKREMDRVMTEIEQFDRSLGAGLQVGRLVCWPQGDGQACYFITKIGPNLVRLSWLPWWDNWQSPVVVDGQALRPAVERAIKRRDGLRTIFGRQSVQSPGNQPTKS